MRPSSRSKRVPTPLDQLFNPASLAVAGASPGKPGYLLLDSLLNARFKGQIYPISRSCSDVSGLKAYASLKDIPGTVDYVICCVPAPQVPQLIRDCAAKGVKVMTLFTAGFSESGTEQGKELEAEIARLARSCGVRLIGPNCMGIYCPKAGLSFSYHLPTESGRVGLVCQSGGSSVYTVQASGYRGVRFSKAVSYGNACDINEGELLEYFARDTETDIVAVYIEGVKDGRRFFRALSDLSRKKPVLVVKGGHTRAGAQAAASHTGALAGSDRLWDDLLEQAGAIRAHSLEDLVDLLVTFSLLRLPRGRKVGIYGSAGGASVLATDDWAQAGFELPRVPDQLKEEASALVSNDAGLILHNPMDFSMFAYTETFYGLVRSLVSADGFVDLSVVHMPTGHGAWLPPAAFEAMMESVRDAVIRTHREINRPLVLVMHYLVTEWHWQKTLDKLQRRCSEAGVPVYYSMASAANAIDRFLRYYERRQATATQAKGGEADHGRRSDA